MASKRILEEGSKDQQKDPRTSFTADDAEAGARMIKGHGDEKVPCSQVHKKPKVKQIHPGYEDPELEQLSLLAKHLIMRADDGSLDGVTSMQNKHYPNGCCEDQGDKWFMYLRQLVDSEGFDMDCTPTDDFSKLPIIPVPAANKSVFDHLAIHAIHSYNVTVKEDTMYKFVEVEKANTRQWCGGCNFWITFQAVRDNSSDAADDDHVLTTFQALVFEDFGREYPEPVVKLCRVKAGF